jgi:hypothetical protein
VLLVFTYAISWTWIPSLNLHPWSPWKNRCTVTPLEANWSQHLSTQIEVLKQSIKAREEDNRKLQSDLKATQEKLQKSEETKEVLASSIVKLQNIVRF